MPTTDPSAEEMRRAHVREGTDPLGRSVMGVQEPRVAPILVAVDGSRASGAALRVAAELSARDGARIEAVLVEAFAMSSVGMCVSAQSLRRDDLPLVARLGRVRAHLCEILTTDAWRLHVEFGAFGSTIAKVASDTGASLIVMGTYRHRPARRLLGMGAVARVLQSAQIPVLAVPATARELPHAALAAIDFSPASLRAARTARDLLVRPGALCVAHVYPSRSEALPEIDAWDAVYDEGVSLKLGQLASDIAIEGVTTASKTTAGPVVESLLEMAHEVNADLIACGGNSLNALERILLGHIPTQLLRRADCSILVAPPPRAIDASRKAP